VSENQTPEVTPVDGASQQPVAAPGTQDLASQIEALRSKNAELISERRKDRENRDTLQQQVEELRSAQEQAKTTKLAESGEYRDFVGRGPKNCCRTQATVEHQRIRSGANPPRLHARAATRWRHRPTFSSWCIGSQISCIVCCRRTYALKKDSLWLLPAASKFQLATTSLILKIPAVVTSIILLQVIVPVWV
jgi:FtsZ-binding cell division protein ZapB